MESEPVLDSRTIEAVVTRSLSCLRTNFRTIGGGRAGWYHYLDDQQPGVTASAVGLYCFRLAGTTFERTDEILRYLLSQQVKRENDHLHDGGWAVRTTNGVPVVEATAWVLRSLNATRISRIDSSAAITRGMSWVENNQNTDFGWGSYKEQPSRVYTTCMTLLALAECGGPTEVMSNGIKWLNEAQSPNAPAWGPIPGAEPTALHTAMALLAQLALPGSLPAAATKQSAEWLIGRLIANEFVEKSTSVEEYDVPLRQGNRPSIFQNSLPHFAGPIALHAMLAVGVDPFQEKIFRTVSAILEAQNKSESQLSGTWELPRSPLRPSIWALWPFLAALTAAQRAVFPSAAPPSSVAGRATLLYPGCALVQTDLAPRHVTRRLLLRNAFFDWLRRRWPTAAIWVTIAVIVGIAVGLWCIHQLNFETFLLTLVLPALLVVFQILWDRRSK